MLFEVFTPFGFDAQEPVICAIQARGRVTVTLAGGAERGVEPDRLDRLASIGVHLIPLAAARHRRYEAVVVTDRRQYISWRSPRVAYLHHGSSFANSESPYAFQLYQEGQYDFLLALHPTEREQAIETFGPEMSDRVRVVGQPKLDRLANALIDAGPVHRALGLPPGRKTVLVTSHWTPTSLLCTCGEVILEQLRNRRDLNVIVTGHHHLWGFPSPWARTVDWRARLAWVGQEPHMRFLPRVPDLHALMAATDVMVSDHSSATAEFAILGRPLVVFRNPAHRFHGDDFERFLSETAEVFRGAEDFLPALERALHQPAPDSGPRNRFLSATFAFLGSSAGQAAEAVEALALTGRL